MSGSWAMPRRQTRVPALVVAALLHAGLLALVILYPSKLPAPVGSSVPINIVSSDKFTDVRQAAEAPQVQEAAAPTPAPEALPAPLAPTPTPPAFTQVAPPKSARAPPAQATPAAHPKPASSLDISRMQQIIASHQAGGQPPASQRRGPARQETAHEATPDAGHGLSQSDQVGLSQLLERLWNPNCDVVGGSSLKLQVKFTVGFTGALLGRPSVLGGLDRSTDPVVSAAARRAVDAVQEATPYAPPYYGQAITVNFDAKEACAKR